jgi:hypothetical protein
MMQHYGEQSGEIMNNKRRYINAHGIAFTTYESNGQWFFVPENANDIVSAGGPYLSRDLAEIACDREMDTRDWLAGQYGLS